MTVERYSSLVFDSARWEDFEARAGDIVISTPPKCGTTWTQMICALLILQVPELPMPLTRLSPWIDMTTRSRRNLFGELAAQSHRRFVKTHTPLDGLPQDPSITYIVVGRDPRDVGISMHHHMENLDLPHVNAARAVAAEEDGIELPPPRPPTPRPTDPREWFWTWVDEDTDPRTSGSSLRFTLHHLETFLGAPDDLDVVLLHYDDLLDDLPGQMKGLAQRLGIDVPQERWPALVEAATLASMREHATTTVPGSAPDQWRDPSQFFRRGGSEQWRELIGDDELPRYVARARALASPPLIDWVHRPELP